jgi:hypothetical protein
VRVQWFDSTVNPGWFDWLGMAVALVGFAVTIFQVVRTRSAAKTATDALEKAQTLLTANMLIALPGQYSLIVSELDHAIRLNQGDMAIRTLVRYGHLAQETIALLQSPTDEHRELCQRLIDTTTRALNTKEKLVQTAEPDVRAISKRVAKEIDEVSVGMSGVVSTIRNKIGAPGV